MIDTLRAEASGVENWNDLLAAVRQEFQGATYHEGSYSESNEWQGATWKDPEIGTMGCKSNRTGAYLWVETSIGKYLTGDNCRLLSSEESLAGVDQLLTAVESKYREFIPDVMAGRRSLWRCKRLDGYYQKEVESVPAVCVALADALGQKSKLAQYMTSVEFRQSREKMARWYGKGFESGNEEYIHTLRHEEQIRGHNRAGYFLDLPNMKCRVGDLRCYMNDRYKDWPKAGMEVPDVSALIREHKSAGMAAAALVLCPALEAEVKRELAENTFYKYRKLAEEYKRKKVKVDLRVPEDAWRS